MDDQDTISLRCSALVLRRGAVLLCRRSEDWVLPGGTPQHGESVGACVRREIREETGLAVHPVSVAFVLDATNAAAGHHLMEIVLSAEEESGGVAEPVCREAGLHPEFVPLDALAGLGIRPPIAGHIRAFHAGGGRRTAAYLGNVWRPAPRG
ncbi:NUDIX hydrolase [Amycolatopsis rubida]|uniref:NUDIX hydrolase n=1 Tax=Amycolatopsis rubida TaxID=112413 RepID=A0ABX0BX69_9PSEU|nr:NUDIX domain-containing protein [Amycolatopsis sp. M39]MYW93752.1 NUDIX domain-containing protein [Amycolatopsis rubida]NEC58739.1 NUDIX hydrolase [Amycolatopsis rubida]OAP22934.1 NUDIX domain protein [Amycolatopsis sp. M39]